MSERKGATEKSDLLSAYLPMDRCHALAAASEGPDGNVGWVSVWVRPATAREGSRCSKMSDRSAWGGSG